MSDKADGDDAGVKQVSALHHAIYGQPGGDAPQEPVGVMDWDVKPFENPTSASWDVPLSRRVLNRLLLGFMPQDMDDKWFIYTTFPVTPLAQGADLKPDEKMGVVHMIRSWTGMSCIDVVFQVNATFTAGTSLDDAVGRITGLVFEKPKEGDLNDELDWVKKTASGVCRYVLGVKLAGIHDDEEDEEK